MCIYIVLRYINIMCIIYTIRRHISNIRRMYVKKNAKFY